MRKSLILSLIIVVLLAAGVGFLYLTKIGKIKLRADTTTAGTQNYTVIGRSFDPLANAPMPGQTINISTLNGQSAQTQTDNNGNYAAKIQISSNDFINVKQGDGNTEGNTCSLIPNLQTLSGTCNFNFGAPPFDENDIMNIGQQYTQTSMSEKETRLSNNGLIDIAKAQILPNMTKKYDLISFPNQGNLFLTLKDPNDPTGGPYYVNFQDSATKQKIVNISTWVNTLKKTTNYSWFFPIVVVKNIAWDPDDIAYMHSGYPLSTSYMTLSSDADYSTISHEFGHAVDFVHGGSSSDSSYFMTATANVIGNRAITGYASTNSHELFAEFFSAMFEPSSGDLTRINTANQIVLRDAIGLYLRYSPEDSGKYDFTNTPSTVKHIWQLSTNPNAANSFLDPTNLAPANRTEVQNSLIYIYKQVAMATGQDQYFPGQINLDKTNRRQDEVTNGSYMNAALATVFFTDHHDQPLVGTMINLGGNSEAVTPGYLTSLGCNVQAGTGLFNNLPTGIQTLTASNLLADYPIPFAGEKVNLVDGSNYVEVGYQKMTVQYMVYQNAAGVLPMLPLQFIGSFQMKSGATVTGLTSNANGGTPTTLRYPAEGHSLGFYGSPTPLPSGLKGYSYLIDYIVGGNADLLYPIKETLTGPAPFPKMMSPTKTEFSFDPRDPKSPEKSIPTGPVILAAQTAPHSISGIFQKQCSYDAAFTSSLCAALKW